MNTPHPLISGIAPQHIPAVIAVLILPVIVWAALRLARALASGQADWVTAFLTRYEHASRATRVTAALLLITAAVHLALPFGHNGEPWMSLLFLASGTALAALAAAAFGSRRWRPAAALVLMTSIVAYLIASLSGREEPDQVGIATKLAELAALGLVLMPRPVPVRGFRRRLARTAAVGALVVLTVVTGAAVWIGSFVAHGKADAAEAQPHSHAMGSAPHMHTHGHAARAQAGTIMRPSPLMAPTQEQVLAAARLAQETKAGISKYRDYRAAIADGYVPQGALAGLDVHFNHEAYGKDGRILDPKRPEMLVYAFENNRYLLLGAVYLMNRAGAAGPEIGGSITRWHAHNVCITLLPPGFTLVSPFGTCPTASVSLTVPEMMHVWTVDNPLGPYVDGLDENMVRNLLKQKGLKVTERR
ncbi:MAG: hypothetical protein ACRDIC_15675 [bacterium]